MQGALLQGKHAFGGGHVLLKGRFGLLNDAHHEIVLYKDVINAFPARTICPCAVHQNDILYGALCARTEIPASVTRSPMQAKAALATLRNFGLLCAGIFSSCAYQLKSCSTSCTAEYRSRQSRYSLKFNLVAPPLPGKHKLSRQRGSPYVGDRKDAFFVSCNLHSTVLPRSSWQGIQKW